MEANRSNLAAGSNPSQFPNVDTWNFDGCYYNITEDEDPHHNEHVHQEQGLPTQDVEVDNNSAKKKVARRAKNSRHQEDEVICSAWINVSQDAIIGMNQTSGGYWKRFADYFDKYKLEGSQRTQIAVQYRWKTIQKEVNKFCVYLSEIERRNESGKVAEDRLKDAMKMFEGLQNHPFQFTHCWILLRNGRKWCERSTATRPGRVVMKINQRTCFLLVNLR